MTTGISPSGMIDQTDVRYRYEGPVMRKRLCSGLSNTWCLSSRGVHQVGSACKDCSTLSNEVLLASNVMRFLLYARECGSPGQSECNEET